jgi:hypothetical protein
MPYAASAYKRADPLHYLSEHAVAALAKLLCYPSASEQDTKPSRAWLDMQRTAIQNLPENLKLHRSLSLATFFMVDDHVSGRLCHAHHDLRPELIFWCYARLDDEVSTHMDRYRQYRINFPSQCSDELRAYIDRVTAITTLFLSKDGFDDEYGRFAIADKMRYHRVRSRCVACVLSMVGSRAQMLVDLRANMLARKKSKAPRLLTLVEAWMDDFPGKRLELRLESEELAEELRHMRHRIGKLKGKSESQREKYYEGRSKERRHRRHRKTKGPSLGAAFAELFGMKASDKKKHKKEHSTRHGSSKHHGQSTSHSSASRNGSSAVHESSDKARSPRSAHSPPTSSSTRAHRTYGDAHIDHHPVPRSSAPGLHGNGRSSPHTYYDPSFITAREEGLPVNANDRGTHHVVSPETSPRTSSIHSDVSSLSSRSPTQHSRDPYHQSLAPDARARSTDSVDTIRADPVSQKARHDHLHHVFDPHPGGARHSWTSRVTSSLYSTDNNGVRHGVDGSYAASAAAGGYPVLQHDAELRRLLEDFGLGEQDGPMDPEGYDEICCPSSDSEDEEGGQQGEEERAEQYVPARAAWKGNALDIGRESSRRHGQDSVCPICRSDLSDLTSAEADSHVNACRAGVAPGPSAMRGGGRPTVSGINRMVDEVVQGYAGLAVIDNAAAQFTPRPSVAARVRRDYGEEERPASRESRSSRSDAAAHGSVDDRSSSRQSKLGGGKLHGVVR